jgi:Cu2+-exporting ATPase
MERLAEVDTVVFDKTGTLTSGRLRLANRDEIDPAHLALAAAIAARSRHPLSQCLAGFAEPGAGIRFAILTESPGNGLEARADGAVYRLGRAGWALAGKPASAGGTVLARNGALLARFAFDDRLRDGAASTVAELRRRGLHVLLLSGDVPEAVSDLARRLGIDDHAAGVLPADKVARIETLKRAGHKVLMVGDGLNDAPALAAAHVSMAPAEAADIGRNAADFVFLRPGLDAVVTALDVSAASGRLIRQNIGLAVAYNAVAVPIAVLGYVTPLIAAIAMSLSSLLVVGNALRLRAGPRAPRPAAVAATLRPAE